MYNIIIAEDEPLALRTLKNMIERHYPDMQVVGEARSGEEALALIEEKLPDMVFSDIRMPVMDGIELLRQIRARNLDIELVIISGYQDFQFAQSAIRYGVVEYLLKPISLSKIHTFMSKLRDTLNEKYLKKQYECFRNLIVKGYADSDTNRYLMNDRYYIGLIRKKGIPFRYGMQINELEINFDLDSGGHYWVLACRDESEVILITYRYKDERVYPELVRRRILYGYVFRKKDHASRFCGYGTKTDQRNKLQNYSFKNSID